MPALLPPPASKLRLTRREAHKAPRPTPQQARERPRYPALARAVSEQQAKVAAAFAQLRRDWLKASGLDDAKALKNVSTQPADFNAAALDEAIERFMETMAGAKPRGRMEFIAAGDAALVQETNFLGHRIGSVRGAEQVGLPEGDPELTGYQRGRLSSDAFDRLSADGRLRFEDRLGEIKDRMLDGFDAGESPLKIARELRGDLDGYEAGRLRTLVRTEMAISSERAIQDKYQEAGVTMFGISGDPNADALCVDQIEGGPYRVGDEEHMAPFHPGCMCSAYPWVPE